MADDRSSSLLARWTRQRRSVPRKPDPADMGTAFGMEFILDQSLMLPAEVMPVEPPQEPGWFDRWRSGKAT